MLTIVPHLAHARPVVCLLSAVWFLIPSSEVSSVFSVAPLFVAGDFGDHHHCRRLVHDGDGSWYAQISPLWLRRMTPTVPKALTNKILGAEGSRWSAEAILFSAPPPFSALRFHPSFADLRSDYRQFYDQRAFAFRFCSWHRPRAVGSWLASTSLKGKTGQWFIV